MSCSLFDHVVLPGVAIAYLLGWPFFIGAFITGALIPVGSARLSATRG
ncbi:metal ABC transporter permease [Halomonas sp. SpR8]